MQLLDFESMKNINLSLTKSRVKAHVVLSNIYPILTPNGRKVVRTLRNSFTNEDINVVWMAGGLGNQVLQYIFMRWIEETTKVQCLIDDTWYYDSNLHNGYELENVFPSLIVNDKLSNYITPSIWQSSSFINDNNVIKLLTYGGVVDTIRSELGKETNSVGLPVKASGVYYMGYWITSKFFKDYRDMFLEELTFKPISDSDNARHEILIKQSYAVGVHIRRGDRGETPAEYYAKYVKKAYLHAPDGKASFFVFSDEIEWCRASLHKLSLPEDATIFIDNNCSNKMNYIDMQLMSMCNALIVTPRSSFSGVATWLNREKGFIVLNNEDTPYA